MEAVICGRMKIIDFHDCLHSSLARTGMGTVIIEAKLMQQLVHLEQEPCYSFFLELKKAFDSINRKL